MEQLLTTLFLRGASDSLPELQFNQKGEIPTRRFFTLNSKWRQQVGRATCATRKRWDVGKGKNTGFANVISADIWCRRKASFSCEQKKGKFVLLAFLNCVSNLSVTCNLTGIM